MSGARSMLACSGRTRETTVPASLGAPTVSIDLAALPPSSRKVVVAAAIDGAPTFGDVGAIHVTAGPGT
ncbi:hypothetical protein, partial [Streptomyces hygroscopicus]|uniref:hypothetical protein n=1 Tax=Streptomyces hygroscopicus TaxID=1912 RepID=UPI002556B289